MDESEGFSVFLDYTEPLGSVRGGRRLVDTGSDFLFDDLDDVSKDSRRDRDVSFDPGLVRQRRNFQGRKHVFSEGTLF